jgi:hypothetical protein
MLLRGLSKTMRLLCACVFLLGQMAMAAQYRGQVLFNGFPVPGATVTATHVTTKVSTVTDATGAYNFSELADGAWTISVAMQCFETAAKDVTVSASMPAGQWELKLLPLDAIEAQARVQAPVITASATPAVAATESAKPKSEPHEDTKPVAAKSSNDNDGLLINGSSNNAASSPFALAEAFGNMRGGGRGLYTGGIGVILDNSALDARPYSISGLETAKPEYSQVTSQLTLGGPIRIPHLLRHGPTFFAGYLWKRDSNTSVYPGLVPDAAERAGDFNGATDASGQPIEIYDPVTKLPFLNNQVPVSSQAQALLGYYPLPNVTGNSAYNYQIPVLSGNHADALNLRLDKSISHRDDLFGSFAF